MADWTDIDVNTLLPGEPVTAAIMLALEENPRAISEGALGAPKIADKIVSGAGTTTVSGLEPFGGMIIRGVGAETVSFGRASASLSIEYSTDDGATFSAPQTLFAVVFGDSSEGARGVAQAEFYINFASAEFKGFFAASGGEFVVSRTSASHLTGTVTGLTDDVTDIRLTGLDALLINPQGGDTAS